MSDEGEKFSVKVAFEYFTEKNEPKLSKPFDVKLVISEENLTEVLNKIHKTCKFKKEEERFYYYIFDQSKNAFITNGKDLLNFVKQNKNLIMKNCTSYAKQMIELLREEEQRNKLGKNVNVNNNTNAPSQNLDISPTVKSTSTTGEETRQRKETITNASEKKFVKKIFDFETNLNCDLFAE